MLVAAFGDSLYVALLHSGTIKTAIGIQQSTRLQRQSCASRVFEGKFSNIEISATWEYTFYEEL